jgi:hypothetical protein
MVVLVYTIVLRISRDSVSTWCVIFFMRFSINLIELKMFGSAQNNINGSLRREYFLNSRKHNLRHAC